MAKKKKIICKHCKEMIDETTCSLCGKKLTDECLVCHKELVHDEISNQNIHICGNDFGYLNSVDKDYDAYHLSIGE